MGTSYGAGRRLEDKLKVTYDFVRIINNIIKNKKNSDNYYSKIYINRLGRHATELAEAYERVHGRPSSELRIQIQNIVNLIREILDKKDVLKAAKKLKELERLLKQAVEIAKIELSEAA